MRGHRVELGEVEAGVSQNSLVSHCCASCEGPTLIAFITLNEKGKASLSRATSPSSAGAARPDHPCRLSGVTESVIRWRLRRTLPGVRVTHARTRARALKSRLLQRTLTPTHSASCHRLKWAPPGKSPADPFHHPCLLSPPSPPPPPALPLSQRLAVLSPANQTFSRAVLITVCRPAGVAG